jgi:hypothetical protein
MLSTEDPGLRSPSNNLVGMMLPGPPAFAFGRNAHVAWGGTNQRARSSQLVDVGGLDPAIKPLVKVSVYNICKCN